MTSVCHSHYYTLTKFNVCHHHYFVLLLLCVIIIIMSQLFAGVPSFQTCNLEKEKEANKVSEIG